MEFAELEPEQQVRALAAALRFLAENDCAGLEAAAARLGLAPERVWARILGAAEIPETTVPWGLIGARAGRRARLGFHQARLLDLLARPEGVSRREALEATGWNRCLGTLRRTAHEAGRAFVTTRAGSGGLRHYAVLPDRLDGFARAHAGEEPVEVERPEALRLNARRICRVTLEQVIEAGFLAAPLEIEACHRGRDLAATIRPDGTILFDGRPYPSPSAAGSAATGKVACPGWAFWKYREPATGRLEPISDFRQLYLDNTEPE